MRDDLGLCTPLSYIFGSYIPIYYVLLCSMIEHSSLLQVILRKALLHIRAHKKTSTHVGIHRDTLNVQKALHRSMHNNKCLHASQIKAAQENSQSHA